MCRASSGPASHDVSGDGPVSGLGMEGPNSLTKAAGASYNCRSASSRKASGTERRASRATEA